MGRDGKAETKIFKMITREYSNGLLGIKDEPLAGGGSICPGGTSLPCCRYAVIEGLPHCKDRRKFVTEKLAFNKTTSKHPLQKLLKNTFILYMFKIRRT